MLCTVVVVFVLFGQVNSFVLYQAHNIYIEHTKGCRLNRALLFLLHLSLFTNPCQVASPVEILKYETGRFLTDTRVGKSALGISGTPHIHRNEKREVNAKGAYLGVPII